MANARKYLPSIIALIVVIGIIAASIWFFRPKPSPDLPTTIRIGIATWPGFASGMVGKEKGFFEGIDLEYRTIDDLPARHAAFRSGDLDIMISSVDLWVQEKTQGIEGKAFLVTDESAGGDGIVAKPSIKTLADLRGKKVAFARATPSHYLLFKAMEKVGLTPSDIEQVKVEDPGNAGQAFLGGSVDAAVTWEPFLTQVRESSNGHVLTTSKEFPGTIVDVLIASPKLLSQPDVLSRFIQGWLKSVAYIKSHPDEATEIIAKGLEVKKEDIQGMTAGLQFADTDRNRFFLCADNLNGSRLAAVGRDAGEFWKRQGILSTSPAIDELFTQKLCEISNLPTGSSK